MKLDNFDIMTLILTFVSYFARYLSLQNNDLFSPTQCIINFFKGNSWYLEIFDLQVDYSQTIVLIIIGPITSMQGRPSPPEAMMHFPLCFRFPPIFENFSDSVENVTCSRKDFHPPKFLMTL